MSKSVTPDKLLNNWIEIQKLINANTDEVVSAALDEVNRAINPMLKSSSPRSVVMRKGKKSHYADDWKGVKYIEGSGQRLIQKNKQWRLTHLLENGHAKVYGGRNLGEVPAFEHIAPAQDRADEMFMNLLKQGLRQ